MSKLTPPLRYVYHLDNLNVEQTSKDPNRDLRCSTGLATMEFYMYWTLRWRTLRPLKIELGCLHSALVRILSIRLPGLRLQINSIHTVLGVGALEHSQLSFLSSAPPWRLYLRSIVARPFGSDTPQKQELEGL